MNSLIVKNISSLEKILTEAECGLDETDSATVLIDEKFSYQIAYKSINQELFYHIVKVEIESDISDCISVYCTRTVPVTFSANTDADENYITRGVSMIPDVLEPYNGSVAVSSDVFRSIWITVKPDKNVKPGVHTIKIIFKNNDEIEGVSEFEIDVIGAQLPELDIPNTNWFHCDCIADWHDCEVFSEKHWDLIDKYMKMASDHGVNMILTPVITPALDTMIGNERPTVQLLDIACSNGEYSFGFDKLEKWLSLCRKNNIKYIEVAHLFTQWGGEKTPKVVVTENNKKIKKFGWHTDALSDEYKNFIRQLLLALTNFFSQKWDKNKVYFHLSDEPSKKHIEHYSELYRFVKPLLGEFKHMDALSEYELYEKGFVDVPVVVTSSIYDFLDKDIKEIWAYTCCMPYNGNYSNRFIAMPSWRNRILGLQMYKYNIRGFLHWGYNFYYSRLSIGLINPYINNDAEGRFPAGDAYGVYPVPGGVIPSIRYMVFHQGLQDMMAAKLLESLAGKEEVMKIIESEGKVEFNICPTNGEYILKIRKQINEKIKEYVK